MNQFDHRQKVLQATGPLDDRISQLEADLAAARKEIERLTKINIELTASEQREAQENWKLRGAVDSHDALEAEIERLKQEISELKGSKA